jgi:hypothetical protein
MATDAGESTETCYLTATELAAHPRRRAFGRGGCGILAVAKAVERLTGGFRPPAQPRLTPPKST